jgi:hypothetical protein
MRQASGSSLLASGHLSVLVGILMVLIESYLCLNLPKAKIEQPEAIKNHPKLPYLRSK